VSAARLQTRSRYPPSGSIDVRSPWRRATTERWTADLRKAAGDAIAADNFRALRPVKTREMVRIAVREVANAARLEQTTAELSQIAEICIRSVYETLEYRLAETTWLARGGV